MTLALRKLTYDRDGDRRQFCREEKLSDMVLNLGALH
jgi:hypothetical protein